MSNSRILEKVNKNKIKEYFIRYGERLEVDKESTMCSPKLTDAYVYYLERGIAGFSSLTDDGEETVMLFFQGNRLLGFTPMLMRRFRGGGSRDAEPFGIDTKTDCVFYRIDEKTFNRLMDDDPVFMTCVLEIVTCNYVDLVHKYHESQGNSAKKRFAKCLLDFSVESDGRRYVPKAFTYVEIAKYLGVHPVTVSKMAAELRKQGIIQKSPMGILILDGKRLESRAAEEE